MPEFWLTLDYVGFDRAFVTGRTPDNEDFGVELTKEQLERVNELTYKQHDEMQKFLMEMVTNES